MKVLVVGTGGALQGSGITTMADQMVRTLGAMGHEAVRLVTGDRLRERPNHVNLQNVIAALGDAIAVRRVARQQRPDVVWIHTFGVPTLPCVRAVLVAAAGRVRGAAVVTHLHAFDLGRLVSEGGITQDAMLRVLGRLSSRLVVLSDSDRTELSFRVPRGRISTLGNWVEVADAVSPPSEAPTRTLLYVGGLVTRKGLPELLQAMRILDGEPVRLRVLGGPGDQGPQVATRLVDSAEDLVRRGRVEFAGQVSHPEVRASLAKAHLLVLPSRAEGMPMSVLEAMAEGRAVVVSDTGNLRQTIEHHRCGVVLRSVDPGAIASAVRSLLVTPDVLAELGLRAHRAALQHFSPIAATAAINEILDPGGRSLRGVRRGAL